MLLFDVKMYYYCEIIMYNIFCSIKNQLHISSLASHGQKIVLPRNTCIFPWNKLFLYHAELYTTSLLPKNQGCQTFTFNIIILWAKLSRVKHFIYSEVKIRFWTISFLYFWPTLTHGYRSCNDAHISNKLSLCIC